MSVETVRDFFARHAPDIEIIELDDSTATRWRWRRRAMASNPGWIAKTLSLKVQERYFLVVTRGDARLDNKKAKARFGGKVTMLGARRCRQGHGTCGGRGMPVRPRYALAGLLR